jgi:[ribosomal protein S18]-alanine N-acetyltransferase
MLNSAIRPMQSSDLQTVCHLYEEANRFADFETILGWTKRNLNQFPDYHWVFESEGRIVGAISGIEEAEGGHIEDLAVLPDLRGHGIGGQLIQHLLDRYETFGISTVGLWAHEKNWDAIPFYEKNGFRKIGEQITHGIPDVPDGERIVVMKKG